VTASARADSVRESLAGQQSEIHSAGPEPERATVTEATSSLAKLLPVETQPLPVSRKPQMLPSELAGQQPESLWTAEKYSW